MSAAMALIGGVRVGVRRMALVALVVLASGLAEVPAARALTFYPRMDYPTAWGPNAVVVGDLNGDGIPDLVMPHAGDSLSVLLGTGTGGFNTRTEYATSKSSVGVSAAVAIGDLNGDGNLDVVVTGAMAYTPVVSVYLGNGHGGLGARTDILTNRSVGFVAIADMDGDGKPDLVLSTSLDGGGAVAVMLGNGAGGFGAPTLFAVSTGYVYALAVADVDGDGRLDVVTVDHGSNTVAVLLGNGAGGVGPATNFPTGLGPGSVAIGDLNGDGKPDLVVANSSENTISVLLGIGGGAFGPKTDYSAFFSPTALVVCDVDGDGIADVLLDNQDSDGHGISFFPGTGTGALGTRVWFDLGSVPQALAVSDFNGDGYPDCVTVSNNFSTGTSWASVLLGVGAGTFGPQTRFATGLGPLAVALGDLGGDGKADLAIARPLANATTVLAGDGGGAFGAPTDFVTGASPWSVTIGDLGADGRPDLVVPDAGDDAIAILQGTGANAFGARTNYATGASPVAAAIGDLNGDGRPDLAVANFDSNSVSVLLGTGGGAFGPRTDYATGAAPFAVALADVGGDGKPDLVVANQNANTVSVRTGNGAGAFGTRAEFATGIGPRALALGDLNGDGRPDLAVANSGDTTVSILLNNAAGGFGSKTDVGVGRAPSSVTLRDVDGDGRLDLVVSNWGAGTITVRSGNGAGGFTTRIDYPAGSLPASLAVGDVNGDGHPDLVTANWGSDDVSVLLGLVRSVTTVTPTTSLCAMGYPVRLAATVAPVASSGWTPTGVVRFFDGTTLLGTAALSTGVASLTTLPLALGDRAIKAVFLGDSHLYGSISGTRFLHVLPESLVAGVPARSGPGFALAGVYPNPTTPDRMAVAFALAPDLPGRLDVLDVSGRRVSSREVGAARGWQVADVAAGRRFAPGLYLVRLTQGSSVRVARATVLQ